jgi:hypothetical protein
MKVKFELTLTRTITVDVHDNDLNDLKHLARQLQNRGQETVQEIKVVELNGHSLGTSLDAGSAFEVSGDGKIARFRQVIPTLLQKLQRPFNCKHTCFSFPRSLMTHQAGTDESHKAVDGCSYPSYTGDYDHQNDKSATSHIESVSHDKAWQAMDIVRQGGNSMFGSRT